MFYARISIFKQRMNRLTSSINIYCKLKHRWSTICSIICWSTCWNAFSKIIFSSEIATSHKKTRQLFSDRLPQREFLIKQAEKFFEATKMRNLWFCPIIAIGTLSTKGIAEKIDQPIMRPHLISCSSAAILMTLDCHTVYQRTESY